LIDRLLAAGHRDSGESGGLEWEIPRGTSDEWTTEATELHAAWWKARIARHKDIDASIAANAPFEYLYDKPYEDKKAVRMAGGQRSSVPGAPATALAPSEPTRRRRQGGRRWPIDRNGNLPQFDVPHCHRRVE